MNRLFSRRSFLASCSCVLAACAHEAPSALPPDAAQARYVLMGEVHDNPRHHELRAQWLRTLMADGRPTWVVFEQMDAGRNAELRAAAAADSHDAEAVASAGGMDLEAWRWPLHRPLFEAALAGGATLAGGNLARDAVRAVVRGGEGAVPSELHELLRTSAWSPTLQARLETEIGDSHCGALPASQFGPMALAQRARDASLARAMLAAPADARVVLIAGNGHVRRDRGVPLYLLAGGAKARDIRSIGLLEEGDDNPPAAAFDLVVRTPRQERPDPCEAMRPSPPASGSR